MPPEPPSLWMLTSSSLARSLENALRGPWYHRHGLSITAEHDHLKLLVQRFHCVLNEPGDESVICLVYFLSISCDYVICQRESMDLSNLHCRRRPRVLSSLPDPTLSFRCPGPLVPLALLAGATDSGSSPPERPFRLATGAYTKKKATKTQSLSSFAFPGRHGDYKWRLDWLYFDTNVLFVSWKAKFVILHDVIFLVMLQEKFEIYHSWEWKV